MIAAVTEVVAAHVRESAVANSGNSGDGTEMTGEAAVVVMVVVEIVAATVVVGAASLCQ